MYILKLTTKVDGKFKRVHGEVAEETRKLSQKLLDKQYDNMVIDSNIIIWYS